MIPDNVEKIIMTKEDYDRNVEQLIIERNELQQRIDKAIEYIENTPLYTETYDYNTEDNLELQYVSDEKAYNDLLNILKENNNENK